MLNSATTNRPASDLSWKVIDPSVSSTSMSAPVALVIADSTIKVAAWSVSWFGTVPSKPLEKSLKDGIQQRFVCRVWIGVSKYPVKIFCPVGVLVSF